MRQFSATIQGVTPFLFNRMLEPEEVITAIGKMPKDVSKVDAWRREEARLRLYKNGQGLYLPSRNIRAAMVAASGFAGLKHKPTGKGTGSSLGRYLRSGLIVEPAELEFGHDGADLSLLGDWVRIPPGPRGAFVKKYWPQLDAWSLSFTLSVFDDSLQEDAEIGESLKAAGLYCGLGTGRPDFGKFKVVDWSMIG